MNNIMKNISPSCKVFIYIGTMYCYFTFKNISQTMYKIYCLYVKNKGKQYIISSKNKKSFCNSDSQLFIEKDHFFSNKKIITISPGGFKGFYILGILTFIKENYHTDNLIFSGASAGAWNSLFMCYKGDPLAFVYNFLDINIQRAKSISELQYFMKYKLLSTYKSEDFELKKLFIGVTTFKHFLPNINIYSDFNDLEDAINCCMASSHIPLVTGGVYNRYKNMFSFDGGFSKYPYLDGERILHISFTMWDELKQYHNNKLLKQDMNKINMGTITNFSEFFSVSKKNLLELFDNGYNDAKTNKFYLDKFFQEKDNNDNLDF